MAVSYSTSIFADDSVMIDMRAEEMTKLQLGERGAEGRRGRRRRRAEMAALFLWTKEIS